MASEPKPLPSLEASSSAAAASSAASAYAAAAYAASADSLALLGGLLDEYERLTGHAPAPVDTTPLAALVPTV